MSLHKSLKVKNKHVRARNVLSREERIKRLMDRELWSEGTSVFGLPKVRVESVSPRKRGKPEQAQPAAGEAAQQAAPEAPEQSQQ